MSPIGFSWSQHWLQVREFGKGACCVGYDVEVGSDWLAAVVFGRRGSEI